MGKLNITASTGIGVISDEATAILNDVVKGKTALTSDSKDELGLGTLELTGTTTPAHVLTGDSFYNTNVHIKETGTMPNNPAQNANLNCGQSKVIPAGYNPGGTVKANSLASQTGGATATDAFVRQGYTYWKDGIKRTGTMAVSSVVSFSVAAYSTSQVLCTWTNPAKAPYSGFAICGKEGGYPTSIHDNRRFTGAGSNSTLSATNTAVIGGLASGRTYYFRIWVYCNTSTEDLHSAEYKQATVKTTANGRQAFTSSGTFTVPAGVRAIDIHCTGGGGNGGAAFSRSDYDGAGGAGGYTSYSAAIAVTPGEVLSVAVGIGGRQSSYAGSMPPNTGTSPYYGGISYVSRGAAKLCSALGGSCGYNPTGSGEVARQGGNGGSGGGAGCYTNRDDGATTQDAGQGGSDGTAGYTYHWKGPTTGEIGGKNAGTGQNRTTREFGSPSLTLYSGGGGGAGIYPAPGGAGGGGRGGASSRNPAIAGSAGTGGGGGGGSRQDDYNSCDAPGGSGNVIIRW